MLCAAAATALMSASFIVGLVGLSIHNKSNRTASSSAQRSLSASCMSTYVNATPGVHCEKSRYVPVGQAPVDRVPDQSFSEPSMCFDGVGFAIDDVMPLGYAIDVPSNPHIRN